MTTFVRLRYRPSHERPPVSIWAVKLSPASYRQVDAEGEWGTNGRTTLVVVSPSDVVWEKPARIDPHYGTLETVETV